MSSLATPARRFLKRTLNLSVKLLTGAGLGIIFTVALAHPDIQQRYGRYAVLLIPFIVVGCAAWVAAGDYANHRRRLRCTPKVAVAASFDITIKDESGDASLVGRCEVVNRGYAKVKNMPPILVGVEHSGGSDKADAVVSELKLEVSSPSGKRLNPLSEYRYADDKFLTRAWIYQIPDGLERGESIVYHYQLPVVPGSEAEAFKDTGGSIVVDSHLDSFDKLSCNLTAPPGYWLEILSTCVRDEFRQVNDAESRRVKKQCSPRLPAEKQGQVLMWEIETPFPRHEYECRYRLRKR